METFSIITANLRFGRADDGPNGWEFRKNAMLRVFWEFDPDFISVQEANDFQATFISQNLPEYRFTGLRKSAPAFWQSNIIYYKKTWEMLDSAHFYLSPTPDSPSKYDDSKWPRQCTFGKFRKNKKTLVCANTHFDFLSKVQVRSARLILKKLRVFCPDDPVVLTGDFNADPKSQCRKVLTKGGFSDVFDNRFSGTHHRFTGRPDSGRIDWILYKGQLCPIKSKRKIIRKKYTRYPSDHFPVLAAFKLIN